MPNLLFHFQNKYQSVIDSAYRANKDGALLTPVSQNEQTWGSAQCFREETTMAQHWGAGCFGAVIGWFTYYTMRYSSTHTLSDVATVIGALGGAAVLAIFPNQKSDLFSFYAIGLAVGFFVYVAILMVATIATSGLKGLVDQATSKNPFMAGRT